ncbi:MAG: DNA primase [Candidatus Limiplasma sp.]|nr:DNA primase [Candidatus Limiplasma sp.]
MAGRFPPAWLEELRTRADIVQIVSAYVPLKKNGHRYVGLCPFHNEKTPSFNVDAQKQVYYCFGCKAGGSVIQFVMDIEHLDFQEAVAALADRLHMPLPQLQNDPEYERRRTLRERVYQLNQAAARLYHQALGEPQGASILAYAQKRGLSDAVIRRFGIGAATGASLMPPLLEQGFTREELLAAGLCMEREGRVRDLFRQRLLFPILDAHGNVLGFGGRAMGDAQPKYLNTPDTPAFNKRQNVFAANLLRKARGLTRVILVEGYMDVASLMQFGVEGVAATLGTALTPEQARLLTRFAPEVWLAYDGDSAGQKAILRGLDVLEAEHVPARVLDFPGGLDPDEFIRQEGIAAFEALKPISGVTYRMRREKEMHDLSAEEGRAAYAKACAEILKAVREPVELETYLKQLAFESGFNREVLLAQIGVAPQRQRAYVPRPESVRKKPDDAVQADRNACTLLAVLSTCRLPDGVVSAEEFTDPQLRAIAEALLRGESVAALMESQPDDRGRALVGAVLAIQTDEDDAGLMRMAQDCLRKMRVERLAKEWEEIQRTLPNVPESEQPALMERAVRLTIQLKALE